MMSQNRRAAARRWRRRRASFRRPSHDAQVAFDCIALGELDRAHTHALTARVAATRR